MENWYILVLVTAVLAAVSGIVRKHVLRHEHPGEQLAAEAPFMILIMLFFIPLIEVPSGPELFLTYALSILFSFTVFLKNKAYRHMPISVIAPLKNLSPLILFGLAAVTLQEKLSLIQLGGLALVVIGGYALEIKPGQFLSPIKNLKENKTLYLVAVLLVFLSLLGLSQKWYFTVFSTKVLTYVFWLHLFFAINNIAINYYRFKLEGVATDIKRDGVWLGLIALITLVDVSLFFYVIAQPAVLISLAIPLRRMATIIETFIGGSLFHEKHLFRKVAICTVMVIGVVLII